jgi:hypothetical protein
MSGRGGALRKGEKRIASTAQFSHFLSRVRGGAAGAAKIGKPALPPVPAVVAPLTTLADASATAHGSAGDASAFHPSSQKAPRPRSRGAENIPNPVEKGSSAQSSHGKRKTPGAGMFCQKWLTRILRV